VQYVEGVNGETARHSRVSALVAESVMNHAGWTEAKILC